MTRIGSLFSGAGGLDLAVQAVFGGDVVWHSEIDKAASKVLAHRFPGVPNLGSVTDIDWATVPPVDVLCGGFPCQDVSAAGKRAGIKEGTRSGLWSVFAEAIDQLRPPFVVIENVRGLLSATAHRDVECDQGIVGDGSERPVLRAAGAVLGDLADLGYDAQWATVAAADIGAPHRRERVFIVAHSEHSRPCGETHDARGRESDIAGCCWRCQPEGCGMSYQSGPQSDAADSSSDGRDEWRPESAGFVGGFDAAVSGDEPGVALLPTPVVTDAMGARNSTAWRSNPDHGISIGDTLTDAMWKLAADRGEMELPTGPTRGSGDEPGVALLPTPNADVGRGVRSPDGIAKRIAKGDKQFSLEDAVALLLTPNAQDGNGGGRYSSPGHQSTLPGEVRLLPTPRVGGGGDCESERRRNSPGLESEVAMNYLPTPTASDCTGGGQNPDRRVGHTSQLIDEVLTTAWGKYEPAIRRWESLVGPAPAPTEPNKNGNPRLSAAFSEWLMGWPAGWVTDPAIGISRNDQLRIVGNGVVTLQCVHALRYLLSVAEVSR